jgi:hypothetical protein
MGGMPEVFPLLILNARPAAGKSEILHALADIPPDLRIGRFHLGELHVLDDFPMLWSWFEEDLLLEQVFRRPRLHTTPDGYFLNHDLWHLLIRRLSLEVEKFGRDRPANHTIVLEFSRGVEHGGYQAAYAHLSPEILRQAACLYVRVSYQESLRKNRRRFNPHRPDSILEHGLSDEKLERLYRLDDWETFSRVDPAFLHIGDFRLPYAVYENEDDLTTEGGERLLSRLEACCDRLWGRWTSHQPRPPA